MSYTKIQQLEKELKKEREDIYQQMVNKVKDSGLIEKGRKIAQPIKVDLEIIPNILKLSGNVVWNFQDEGYDYENLKFIWLDKKSLCYKFFNYNNYLELDYFYENDQLLVDKDTRDTSRNYYNLIDKWAIKNELDEEEVREYICGVLENQ